MSAVDKLRRGCLAAGMFAGGFCAARGEWLAGAIFAALGVVWWRVLGGRRDG